MAALAGGRDRLECLAKALVCQIVEKRIRVGGELR